MSLASLIVRIGADVSELNRGVGSAERIVDQFGKKMATTGRSVARMGNRVTMAAGSLQRLAGVMPGVSSKTVSMVTALGTAGMVLGETAVLSTALTKAWRLLTVASAHLASALPAALAPLLGNPITLALAGVAALTAAFIGLKSAITSAGKAKAGMMDPNSPFFITPEGFRESFFKAQAQGDANRALGKADIAAPVIEAWRQAVAGIRPLTDKLVDDWDAAQSAIAEAFQHSARLTREQINDLHELRAALKAVMPRTPGAPLSLGESAGMIRKDIVPQKMFGHGLNARQFLGDKMDFRPTPMAKPSFFDDLKRSLRPSVPTDSEGNPLSAGTRTGMMLQSGAGAMGGVVGEMMQGIAMFGPLGAVMPIITSAFQALAPVIEPLVPIIKALGQIIAVSLTPVIKFVVTGLSYLAEAVGWVIRGIGRLVDALPGISAKGVINAGQAMIDAARAARRNADATDNATDKVNEFAGALSNIPRVFNVEALRHLVGAGSSKHGGGPGGGVPPGTKPPTFYSNGDININVYGATDPIKTAEAIGREMDRRFSRGGTSRLAVSLV